MKMLKEFLASMRDIYGLDNDLVRKKVRALVRASEKRGRELEREDCAKVAEAEQVNAEATGDETDYAYNRACEDIAAAIRKGRK